NSPARWAVAYRDSGTRHYSINDGRTGGSEIYEPQIPVWNGGSLVTSNDRNGVWSIAPASYYSTTSTVATQSVVTGSTIDVGTNPFAHFIPSRITQEVSYGSYTYYDTSDWRIWNWGWRTVYYPIYRDRFDHGFWIQSSIYETFTNFISNWTSKKQDIKDQRQELSFQLVTKPQENYDQRPKFETKESTTKVVQNKSVTQWKTENITENQTLIVTTREWQDNGTGLQAEFTQPSILADGNVNIASGHDVTIEAFVRSAGTDQTVSVIAGRDVVLNGFVPDGSDSTTLAAVAVLAADGAVIVTAGRDVAFDEFSSVAVDQDAGGAGSVSTVQISAAGDISLDGLIAALHTIEANAGTSGSGSVNLTINALLTTSGSDLTLEAGSDSGNVVLSGAMLN
ncbi:MAG: hypothetical protein ACK6EB_47250, partial [Planctomyces sp.]